MKDTVKNGFYAEQCDIELNEVTGTIMTNHKMCLADPEVTQLALSKIYGSNALIVWEYAVSCYVVTEVMLSYKTASVEREVRLPAMSKSFILENLAPVTYYDIHVVVLYMGGNRSKDTVIVLNSGGIGK